MILAMLLIHTAASPASAADDAVSPDSQQQPENPVLQMYDVSQKELPSRLFLLRPRGLPPELNDITIHGSRDGALLVSGSTVALRALSLRGCEVTPLPHTNEPPLPPEREWHWILDPDPAIAAMVDQVRWEDVKSKIQYLVDFGTRHSFASNHHHVASSIASVFESYGLNTRMQSFLHLGQPMWNIEATQTGTRYPDSYVIICGHYDSTSRSWQYFAPGADDNGTGVAAVLTAAEILSRHDFEYSIRYVCFDTEELGLIGSRYYALQAARYGLDIVGALNFDMIGYWTPGVEKELEIEANEASRWLAHASMNAAELYTDTEFELHVYDDAWWGDHYSFWRYGFTAVNHEESWDWYDPDFNPYYHSVDDLLEHVDPGFTVGNIMVGVATLALLSIHDPPLAVIFDVRPGSSTDPFNPKSRGVAWALVPGSADVDVHEIDLSSLRVAGSIIPSKMRISDIASACFREGRQFAGMTPDGIDDLRMQLSTEEIASLLGPMDKGDEVVLRLTGLLVDGTRINGEDRITIVGGGSVASMDPSSETPTSFWLHQNTPNPFNPVTSIRFDAPPGGGEVMLRIYDVSGRLVRTLFKGTPSPGRNEITWNGRNETGADAAAGLYFCRLTGHGFSHTRKMMLIR
jgi:hypothetical protein